MIFVTLGTMHLDFERLIRRADAIAASTGERIVVQTGLATTQPQHCEHFDFRAREEIASLMAEARVVVTHAGIGSVIDALHAQRPLVVVPRQKRFGEHNDDHQRDLARAVEQRGWGRAIFDIEDLDDACATPPQPYTNYAPAKDELIRTVRTTIEDALAGR